MLGSYGSLIEITHNLETTAHAAKSYENLGFVTTTVIWYVHTVLDWNAFRPGLHILRPFGHHSVPLFKNKPAI